MTLTDLLTLIEDHCRAGRMTHAQASLMTSQMDLNAPKVWEQHNAVMASLRGLAGVLLQQNPPPVAVNGGLKLAG